MRKNAIIKCKKGTVMTRRRKQNMKEEMYFNELRNLPASRINVILKAVNEKKALKESDAKSEVEKMLYERTMKEARTHEQKYGKWPVFEMCEIESDDPALDIYHD